MDKINFKAELIEGHKGVTVVIVPFVPEETWKAKPIKLDERRHGWLVVGSVNGKRFEGYIGERWGRYFIQVDADLREKANIEVGDAIIVAIEPTVSTKTLAKARELAQETTAPTKPRTDARDPEAKGKDKTKARPAAKAKK